MSSQVRAADWSISFWCSPSVLMLRIATSRPSCSTRSASWALSHLSDGCMGASVLALLLFHLQLGHEEPMLGRGDSLLDDLQHAGPFPRDKGCRIEPKAGEDLAAVQAIRAQL